MEEHAQEALDRIDRRLLEALQADARLTTAELAQQVALSPSPCWRRVKRLEALGLVRGYHAELDPERLGWGVTAFVQVTLERHEPALGDRFEVLDRFPTPDLARLVELRRQIILNRRIRRANRAQRKMSRASRDALLQHLRDVLRVAGAIIIILQFDHTISLDLQKWGFEVVKRPCKTKTRAQEKAVEGVVERGGG